MIGVFRGHYRFLSNFWPAVVQLDGVGYCTVEHAYVASKTLDKTKREVIRFCATPGEAKRVGRSIQLRSDWNAIRLSIMADLIEQKFEEPRLRAQLLATGNEELVEGNSWGDTFWGVCNGLGENHLGKILMATRGKIQRGEI